MGLVDRATLLSLADEVERLTERGNFEMECRILLALHPVRIDCGAAFWTVGDLAGTKIRIPNYTVSIDSAASLMPEGWGWKVEFVGPLFVMSAYHATLIGPRVEARTEALARAAAGLRARAAALRAMAGGDDDR